MEGNKSSEQSNNPDDLWSPIRDIDRNPAPVNQLVGSNEGNVDTAPVNKLVGSNEGNMNTAPVNKLVGNNEGDMDTGTTEPEQPPRKKPGDMATGTAEPKQPPRRKPGRPRKYPEEGSASRKATVTHNSNEKKGAGNEKRDFVPYILTVGDGEDILQKIMSFVKGTRRQVSVMSASGSVSCATLGKPAPGPSGTINVAYGGLYYITSLTGCYVSQDRGSRRTGRFTATLSNSDGHSIGGILAGPLKAAGSVVVVAGTFKKPKYVEIKGEASTQPVAAAVATPETSLALALRPQVGSSSGNPVLEIDEETPSPPPPLGRGSAGFELTGITDRGKQQALEEEDPEEDPDQSSD